MSSTIETANESNSERSKGSTEKVELKSGDTFVHAYDVLGNGDMCYKPLALMGGFWIPVHLVANWVKTYNFPLRSGDVIVATHPKAGTHWIFYTVYLIQTKNFGSIPAHQQLSQIEDIYKDEYFQAQLAQEGPRVFATHMPGPLLAKHAFNGKVIYVERNPKDVAVSLFHHYKNRNFGKNFDEFVQLFMQGRTIFGPYWKHLESYRQLKQEKMNGDKILIVKYEEMKKDTKATIRKIAQFLEIPLEDGEVEKIDQAVAVDNMRKNNDANGSIWRSGVNWNQQNSFIRKGNVGSWRDEFANPQLVEQFEHFCKEKLPGDDFVYE